MNWVTRDGNSINIRDLEDDHLFNIMRLMYNTFHIDQCRSTDRRFSRGGSRSASYLKISYPHFQREFETRDYSHLEGTRARDYFHIKANPPKGYKPLKSVEFFRRAI